MRTRSNSGRAEVQIACAIGLALLAAAPGHSQTSGTAETPVPPVTQAPATTATKTPAATKAPSTAAPATKAPATTTAASKPTTTTTAAPATGKAAGTVSAPTATKTSTPAATRAKTAATQQPGATTTAAKKPTEEGDTALRGGQEGTVFKSLTIEGEDRVRVDFERPTLQINLELEKAPGLEWGSAADVLNRTQTDLQAPLLSLSAKQMTPYLARPWLQQFATGPVARFHPNAEGVERWKLVVVNSKGAPVTTFSGKGDPPREIAWDGRAANGTPVTPGLTYSYVFEAFDRAGNKRNVVGQGFTVKAYRIDSPQGPTLLLSGAELNASTTASPAPALGSEAPAAPPILLEAASWLNQSERVSQPVRVTVTARSQDQADLIASNVKRALAALVLGDPARLDAIAQVEPDAPEAGTLVIAAIQ